MKLAHGVGIVGSLLLLFAGGAAVTALLDTHAEWSEGQTFTGLALANDSLRRELDIARRHANGLSNRLTAIERVCRKRGPR